MVQILSLTENLRHTSKSPLLDAGKNNLLVDDKTPILDTCEKVLSELQLITKQMECLPIISENLQKLLELQETKPNDLQRTQSWSDILKGWLNLSPTHQGQQNDVIHQTENHNTSQTLSTMNVPVISTTDKIFSGISVETASNVDDITLNAAQTQIY